jgi:hypothetical protein
MPLGIDVLAPREHGSTFALYASLEGLSSIALIAQKDPVRADGQETERHFPSPLSFRVTATTLGVNSIDVPDRIDTDLDTAELIKSLQFRLRINDSGLQTKRIGPAETRLIGVPADVPYGERIYRVIFEIPPLSTRARLVLEIVAPNGELLSKFPVTLN